MAARSKVRLLAWFLASGALAATIACKVLPADTTSTIDSTVHDIDVGNVAPPQSVSLTGLVITGVAIDDGVDPASEKCRYRAFAQDPAGDAPSGLVLYAYGPQCQGAACSCPSLPSSGSALDPVATIGDIYNVQGSVSVFHEGADGGLPLSHSVYLTGLTKTGANGFITPIPVSTAVAFGKEGAGYTANESMLVKLSTGAPFPVAKPDLVGSFAAAGGAWVSGDYRDAWWQDGGFPTAFTTLDSITGVASPLAGGGITPRTPDDFVLPSTQ
jgi:hypothetical protein